MSAFYYTLGSVFLCYSFVIQLVGYLTIADHELFWHCEIRFEIGFAIVRCGGGVEKG